ncbi:hypothetical protein [Pseudoalteromonas sp. M8]|uniref:hypothetical protein n=1 Tax=Pseudoalteromonas sp. M8 TaxID=2692624 RepID=UPI001BA84BD8|nr:hypothetical protein [Pseudoalteromonas sp. M8]QUI69601.1 hypothetical protein GSF13_07280 [Pseudoalteromonas sp. M8]
MNSFYNRLTTSLIGMDGGNIKAPLWVSGLEWAGYDEEITSKVTRPTYEVDGHKVPYLSDEWKASTPNFYKWQFDQKVAKILCRAFDYQGEYKDYMKEKYCSSSSNEFKLNLFPLPCRNVNDWQKQHIELTSTKIKYHYQTHCSITRFFLFNQLVKQFNPKVVLCFGQRFIEEYKMAFCGAYDTNSFHLEEYKLGSGKSRVKILTSDIFPTLVIAPFLGRNLVANSELEELGSIIAKYLSLPTT